MKLLLIHQNFPGQFRQLAPHLLNRGHELVAICSHKRFVPVQCRILRYQEPPKLSQPVSISHEIWAEGLQRAEAVALLCEELQAEGWRPDCILAHPGWGETIGLSELWPEIPQIIWPELWTRPEHGGFGSDPLKPMPGLRHRLEHLGRNSLTRVALADARAWVLPTLHQSRSFPDFFQGSNLRTIHEGIDTSVACPNHNKICNLNGLKIDRNQPILTFVNRNLERLRGFDMFMRSLPQIQEEWPDLRVIIVGDDEPGYGSRHPSGKTWKEVVLEELEGTLILDRIHFLGRIPYPQLIALMQVSSVHVYLSYPFVLGWSLLEAMACGCAIVGSKGMPVEEVITDGVEGLLVPLDDTSKLASRVSSLLGNPDLRNQLGQSARRRSIEFDQTHTLPQLTEIIESFA